MIAVALIVGIALASTLLWLGLAYQFLSARFGAEGVMALDPWSLTMVVASVAGPVLVVWMVAGFMGMLVSLRQQGRTIRQLLWQMKRSADHTDVTTRLLIERRQQSQGNAFFLTHRDARDELNGVLASLAARAGLCPADTLPTLWVRYDCGERSVFCNLLRDAAERDEAFSSTLGRMLATDPRMRADALFFLARYDRLIRLGTEWDAQRHVLDLTQDGDLGQAQRLVFKAVHGSAGGSPQETASPRGTGKGDEPDGDGRPTRIWPKGFPPEDALLEDARRDETLLRDALDGDAPPEDEPPSPHPDAPRPGQPFSPLAADFPKQDPLADEPKAPIPGDGTGKPPHGERDR
ncbi:MAG: hypothetical protein HQL33_05815 [Alphaproteobacteria bacterium]|nr:hypothetical protein [Alphaproteobacteria bacterium]MBF0129487.1 hypothetical protein [Alphaproteobacteria bacterium]